MKIKVCVGSSCHLKGAPAVIAKFQEVLKTMSLNEQILELSACFCQECCQEGVVVLVNDKMYTRVSPDQVEALVKEGLSHVS